MIKKLFLKLASWETLKDNLTDFWKSSCMMRPSLCGMDKIHKYLNRIPRGLSLTLSLHKRTINIGLDCGVIKLINTWSELITWITNSPLVAGSRCIKHIMITEEIVVNGDWSCWDIFQSLNITKSRGWAWPSTTAHFTSVRSLTGTQRHSSILVTICLILHTSDDKLLCNKVSQCSSNK